MREFIKPMLCENIRIEDLPTDSNDYFTEIKIDGNRILFFIDFKNGYFRIQNRNVFDKTSSYPEFSLDSLKPFVKCDSCILDGELFRDSFEYVQERSHLSNEFSIRSLAKTKPLCFIVFDILELNGLNLVNYPIEQRKLRLSEVVVDSSLIRKMVYDIGNVKDMFKKAIEMGFEGLVLKKIGSRYEFRRSENWLKLKPKHTDTIEVLGWNKEGHRAYGSLRTPKGDIGLLSYDNLKEFKLLLDKVGLDRIFIEVEYQEITKDGKYRFPIFKRFVVADE